MTKQSKQNEAVEGKAVEQAPEGTRTVTGEKYQPNKKV